MAKKYLISGGGTGGHIFPAISIANALREAQPDCEILFIGAESRMEMERVPAAGYEIEGLKVDGLDRQNILKSIKAIWRLLLAQPKARRIIKEFKPDVAIGVGGYASGVALRVAGKMSIPLILQEQNSFAGVTNKMLAKYATKICVAYSGMERFFTASKIILTGNPVRQNLLISEDKKGEAYNFFGFDANKPTLFVMGGSLGARTINEAVIAQLPALKESGIQLLWQTGKLYFEEAKKAYEPYRCDNIIVTDFVSNMDLAYLMSDLVVSRAGASSISELCLLKKPTILVPSPNVSEDHQTHNAMALSSVGAAILIKDVDAVESLINTALTTIEEKDKLQSLSTNIATLAQLNSANRIAEEVMKISNGN